MPRLKVPKLDLPLDPRAVDQAQSIIALMSEDGDTKSLREAGKNLLKSSREARRLYPRDAHTLSDLGNLALMAIDDPK